MGDLLEIVDEKNEQPDVQLSEHIKPDSIDLKQLINRLNYINFKDGTLTSVFHHKYYNRSISLDTRPEACMGNELSCLWPDRDNLQEEIKNYNLTKIYIDDGIRTIVINPEQVNFEQKGFTVHLPEVNILKPPRKTRRFSVIKTIVQMIQNGVLYRGRLINFTPDSFKIKVQSGTTNAVNRLNPDAPVTITLLNDQQIKFSGECSIIRTSQERDTIFCVLKPNSNQIQRFKAKEYRSFRQKLVPSPNIVFIHPFTGRRVDLPVYDLSGAGFSLEEDQRTSILLPGMIISELEIVLSTGMKVKCKCQVLYRKIVDENKQRTIILTGFSILDMEPYDHVQLLSIIFLAKNRNLYLSKDLDPDALWRFLFESGFIYPTKYAYLKEHKEEIKSSYNKMYTNAPDIARHITYQEKGEILGHMSMLRTYENTWLMHHHAASNTANMGAGLYVMDQLSNYAYNANKIESLHLNYLICYFRPENRFPAKIFGGATKSVNDPKGCSINNFVFFKFQGNPEKIFDDLGSFSLEESNYEDLLNLESYYEEVSGGLMLHAMDILPRNSGSTSVIKAYEKLQFKREIRLYSLKTNGDLLAIFIADISDTGLNMSELTNNIKVIIMQPDNLSKETLEISINEIAKIHFKNFAHVLLFPDNYADRNSMKYEKKYSMWIMNLEHSDAYFKYLKKLMRFIKS
jgi:c-di-GMP-binding flagellar brake protein YcgR